MARLAIKGHTTRGKDVIKFLEMLGGKNINDLYGLFPDFCYTINSSNEIIRILIPEHQTQYDIFILESLLNKCPYKIGDKVILDGCKCNIIKMLWCNGEMSYLTNFCGGYVAYSRELQPYKEETMEEEMLLGWVVESKRKRLIPHKDYEIKKEGDEFYLVKKISQRTSLIKWQTGEPKKEGTYIVTYKHDSRVCTSVLYYNEAMWLTIGDCNKMPKERIIAWYKLSDVEPYLVDFPIPN